MNAASTGGKGDVHAIIDDDASTGLSGTDCLKSGAREFQSFAPAQILFAKLNPIDASDGDGFNRFQQQGYGVGRESEWEAAPVGDVANDRLRKRGGEGHWESSSWVESC